MLILKLIIYFEIVNLISPLDTYILKSYEKYLTLIHKKKKINSQI